jgi:hypothetical protein
MQRVFRFGLIAGGLSFTVLTGTWPSPWPSTDAHAGQPWSCLCNGQIKRTIASTYACETSLYRGSGRRVHEGFKLFVPACTRTQFRAWNRRACARSGCTLVPR